MSEPNEALFDAVMDQALNGQIEEYERQRRDPWHDFDDDGWDCSHCGGDAWEECTDWIQCTYRGCDGEMHPCTACGGTGDGRKQVVW